MQISFDLDTYIARRDVDVIGQLLHLKFVEEGGNPRYGRNMEQPGWSIVEETPRPLLVALMGDAIYEGLTATHVRNDATGIEVLWYADGDLILLFHIPGEKGITISNSRGGYGGSWFDHENLDDPRNDPAYDPYANYDDAERVRAFMEVAEGDPKAKIVSDVDGIKGDYVVKDGKVMRQCGDTFIPYMGSANALRRIADDGAYALEKA